MSEPVELLGLYLHLAHAAHQRLRPLVRDRLLLLSGVIAARMELSLISASCRRLILEHNPQHLVKRWPSLILALEDTDFLHLLKQVQRRYPQEKAERMLDNLGIDRALERQAYYSDEEYAASLLGATPERLQAALDAEDE
ncbi:hypothetical protein [Lignipirellula cremea]|uniref:Uncharacterized protein n=1 Tax=Lignipirellula cremea TaxID=2528010 RepID=A0A518DX29_9BACT|nr:hypothetical protein [Lignipirellula cremea]QDU96393.1 hypothetical protein Pla8534_42130 [Lignipirellula cremea]